MPQYEACAPGYVLIVRDEKVEYHNGQKIILKPVLKVDFGIYGQSGTATDDKDSPITQFGGRMLVADVRGGFIDTDEMAQRERWDDEDKAAILFALNDAATNRYNPAFGEVTLYSPPKLSPPWPAYDDQDVEQILVIAEQTGLIEAAISYEARTAKRSELVEALRDLVTQHEELSAA